MKNGNKNRDKSKNKKIKFLPKNYHKIMNERHKPIAMKSPKIKIKKC